MNSVRGAIMSQSTSQSLAWNWSFTQEALTSQFELKRRTAIIKSIGHSLLGGYQQLMTPSAWGKQSAKLEQSTAFGAVNIDQVGENVDSTERVRECVSIKQRGRQVLTAVRTGNHQLNLISWRVNADGFVVRTGASGPQPGRVTQIAIARARKFVTAIRTAAHQLQLVSWDVSNTGAIYRAGVSNADLDQTSAAVNDEVSKVKLVALSDTLLVTACTTRTGQIKLTSWRLNDNDSLTRLYDFMDMGEAVRDLLPVVLPATENGLHLLMAARTQSGRLKLQKWSVAPTGEMTAAGDSVSAEERISQFDALLDEAGRLITAVRTATSRLKLIAWAVPSTAQPIQRLGDSGNQGQSIRQSALMCHADQLMTAVLTPTGACKLIAWSIPASTLPASEIMCLGESTPQTAAGALVGLCREALDGNAPIMTSTVTANGALKLITWRA